MMTIEQTMKFGEILCRERSMEEISRMIAGEDVEGLNKAIKAMNELKEENNDQARTKQNP